MSLHSVLLALSLLSPQVKTSGTPESAVTPAQQAVLSPDAIYPQKPQDVTPSPDFLGWHGWTYLQGAPATLPKIYDSVGDWGDLKSRAAVIKTAKMSQWRMKIVIFTRVEADERDSSGVLREHRQTIESVQLAQIQAAIERLKGWVATKFDGRVALVPDVQVETDWLRDSTSESGPPYGARFAQRYFEARINGGSYEAEDKVFRGPFNSAMYILPGSRVGSEVSCNVNLTPVVGISALPLEASGNSTYLDNVLRPQWLKQVELRVKEQGYKGITLAGGTASSEDPWPTATSLDEVSPQNALARMNTTLELVPSGADPVPFRVSKLPETEGTIVADPDRGQVLKIVEAAGYRAGGFSLPSRQDGMPIAKLDATPTLSFQVKSTSGDPLALRLESSDGKEAWVSIGLDPVLVESMPNAVVLSAPFTPDGKWQKVSVDLHPIMQKLGMRDVVHLAIEPTPNAKLEGKMRPELIEYSFDEFKFSAEPAQPLITSVTADSGSNDPEARALFAAQAKAASPELGALLKDKNELVRLNATAAYVKIKDPSIESSLVSNSLDLDPTIAATALSALMNDGSDTAISVIRQSVRVAFSDYAKQTAATLLAQTKDPKMAGEVSLLLSNRSWGARVAGVEALALLPSPSAGQISLAFINGTDPAIKLAVTRHTDPSRDEDVRVLLWSAVNEPSDMVRAQSDIKLIQSPNPSNRTEGFKGVRDDSKFVRIVVLDYLASQPKDENRNALRIAIADRSALVRASAINAFAALPTPPTNEEIANVLDDTNPIVQLALIDLAKKKSLKLPKATVDAMTSSQDIRVATAAKGLSG